MVCCVTAKTRVEDSNDEGIDNEGAKGSGYAKRLKPPTVLTLGQADIAGYCSSSCHCAQDYSISEKACQHEIFHNPR